MRYWLGLFAEFDKETPGKDSDTYLAPADSEGVPVPYSRRLRGRGNGIDGDRLKGLFVQHPKERSRPSGWTELTQVEFIEKFEARMSRKPTLRELSCK